jgi:hypothetical protein
VSDLAAEFDEPFDGLNGGLVAALACDPSGESLPQNHTNVGIE